MSINTSSSGIFENITVTAGTLEIPLASIRYGDGTLTADIATGDYRGLIRGIHESYHYFMTGVATGSSQIDNFNKPSYFDETASIWSVYQDDYLKRTYTTDLYYNIMEDSTLASES